MLDVSDTSYETLQIFSHLVNLTEECHNQTVYYKF